MNSSTMRGSSASTSATPCGLTMTFSRPHSGLSSRQRLLGEDVERRARERAVLQALGQRRLVDDRAAADVDEHRAGLDRRERVGVEQAARRVGGGQRDDDAVGAADERAQLGHRVELVDVRDAALEAALDRDHVHAERAGQPRGLGADRADADEQQRLAAQLADRVLAGRPVARALVALEQRQLLGEREQAEDGELGERPGVDAGGRRDGDAVELVGGERQRGAELLAGAGVAGLDPLQARRAADEVDEPLAGAAGDPEHDLGALERVLPARVVERDAALADGVADPAPGRQQLGQVGQLDAVLGGDPLARPRRTIGVAITTSTRHLRGTRTRRATRP